MATETYVRNGIPDPHAGQSAVETLDWKEFRARLFPGRRDRHDFEALVAYGAYRRDRRAGEPSNRGLVERSAGLSAWEAEGGAALS